VCKIKGHNASNCPQENEFDEKDTQLWQKRRNYRLTNCASQENDFNERKNNPNFVSELKRKLEDVSAEKESYILNEIPSRSSTEEIDLNHFEDIYQ
jgi:hypothetical protein